MPLEVCPVLKSDVDAVNRITYAAYADDPICGLLYPTPVSQAIISNTLELELKKWSQDPTERRMQVKDTETGETIGHSVWYFINHGDGANGENKTKKDQVWPEGYFVESATKLAEAVTAAQKRVMDKKPHIYLGTLVTSPDHQRRGAGTKLIQWGIARARALNLPIYLSASPSGLPLYTKLGFKTCGSLGIDGSFFTPPHNLPVRDSICMLLPAPSPDLPPSLPYASTNKTQFPVQILPTTDHADFPFITDISSRAYADNEYIALAFPPGPDPAASRAFTIRSHILNLTADPSNMYHKAVDPFTGLIVGFSYWHFYDDLTREHIAFAGGMPLNANVPLLDVSYERTSKMREEFFSNPPRKWAYCANLCVDPEWHRRGVGKALLEEVLKEVDRQGLEAWLEASDKGKGLYEKLGWKVEMTFDADLSPWGGPKVQRIWCMLRKPRVEGEKSG